MSDLTVKPAEAPFQKTFDGTVFPLIEACRDPGVTVDDAVAWVKSHRDEINDKLEDHAAIVFRGFGLKTADDFDAFIVAFDYEGFTYEQSLSNAVRINKTKRVFTANESPPTATIPLHHEMAQTPIYPSKLFFFCETAAERGGETPLCRSDALTEELFEKVPDFMHACEEKGLKYTTVMPASNDAQSAVGRSWPSTFGVDSREAAERRMRELGYTWTWEDDGSLRATTPVLQGVRELPTGKKSFFNQLIAACKGWKDSRNDPSKSITLGDGTPLDMRAVEAAIALASKYTADVKWEAGDVVLVDNYVAMHGRNPFEGKRAVLASLVKGETLTPQGAA